MDDLFEIGKAFLMAIGGTLAAALVVWVVVTYPIPVLLVILAVVAIYVYSAWMGGK